MATKVDFIPFENLFAVPLRNGLTRPKAVRGKGIKMINMGELFAHSRINNVETDRVPLSDNENSFLLESGDLLFARQSLVLAGAGKCSIFVDDDEEVTYEGHIIRARINSKIADPFFYYYFFNSPVGRQAIESIVEQVAAAGIRGSDLAKLNVPFLPLSEQRAIAGILGALDDKIEVNRRMNATLESMARGVFRQWFVENEKVRNWEIGKISDYAQVTSGKRPEARQDEPDAEFKFPLFGGGGIMAYTDKFLYDFPIILTGRVGTLGIVFHISDPCWPSDNTLILITSKPEYYFYLYFQLKQTDLEVLNRGSTQPLLTQSDLQRIVMPLPPENMLIEFGRVVTPMFAKIDANAKESRTLASLRDGLLPRLMRGEVRVKSA